MGNAWKTNAHLVFNRKEYYQSFIKSPYVPPCLERLMCSLKPRRMTCEVLGKMPTSFLLANTIMNPPANHLTFILVRNAWFAAPNKPRTLTLEIFEKCQSHKFKDSNGFTSVQTITNLCWNDTTWRMTACWVSWVDQDPPGVDMVSTRCRPWVEHGSTSLKTNAHMVSTCIWKISIT
jgi:hypothetical protein